MDKVKTPINLISAAKDIILTFLVCVFILCLVNINGSKENQSRLFWDFNGDNIKTTSPKPKQEKQIVRKFKWEYPKKTKRETAFRIPEADLKSEIKKFGVPHGPSHPFFLKRRGFKLLGKRTFMKGHTLQEQYTSIVDYQQIFQRNQENFKKLTQCLIASADLSRENDPLYAFLSFVQYIRYKLPPRYYKGKFINSFFVPLVCLFEKYGDCDSKALLLAEFLCSVPGTEEKAVMVLVRGSGLAHALLAVKRKLLPGMTALFDVKKGYYIVLETTSPGWAPGFISRRVTDAIKSGLFYLVALN
ncbi:hypothetical protein ACFLQP_00175 [Acidobacteriota bacterium]